MAERQFVALKVIGSTPIIYPLLSFPILKRRIKKKSFKKKGYLLNEVFMKININELNLSKFKLYKFYTFMQIMTVNELLSVSKELTLFTVTVSQKKYNHKATVALRKTLSTFSVGSVIRYFKVKCSKYVRRSTKGVKIFLNFLKRIFDIKYSHKIVDFFLLSIIGIDYHINTNRKFFRKFLKENSTYVIYILYNLKISFTKLKDKKIKSIKKRLRKKILLNFLKKQVH
jgi:hypothetical protein